MARAVPVVQQGRLVGVGATDSPTIQVGTPAWYHWLGEATSFAFVGAYGRFTARKERRHRGGWYWKAYCTAQGKPFRAYLGKTERLTLEQLEVVAWTLAQQARLAGGASRSVAQPGAQRRIPAQARPRDHASQTPRIHSPPRPAVSSTSADDPLLASKLLSPPLRPDMLIRPRLIDALEAQAGGQLMLLAAPAGSGKTTLLAHWSAHSRWRSAWVALDPADNDPIRLWRAVLTALDAAVPGAGQQGLTVLQARQPVPLVAVLTTLLNALTVSGEQVALILDDYHLLTQPSIHSTVSWLLEHLPPTLRVVIASRTEPPLPLGRLRVHQHLCEVGMSDLRFTTEEATAFLQHSMRLTLSPDAIASLVAHTEGWVAGLQLAALALRHQTDLPGLLRALTSGRQRALGDYLAEEVLQQQPKEVQRFLLQTALLERLNGPLCEAVLGDDGPGAAKHGNGEAMLERLERAQLFLVPLDAERRWYRYHHLFAEFLRERLQRCPTEQVRRLHLRAFAWYHTAHLLTEAMPHALAAEAFSEAAELLEQVGEPLLQRGEVSTLREWLERLPDALVRARPRLCLLNAWTLVTAGQIIEAAPWLELAEQPYPTHAQACPEAAETPEAAVVLPPDGRAPVQRALLGEIAALRAHLAAFWGETAATLHFAQRALDLLPHDQRFLRGLSALNLGIGSWLEGDLLAASQALAQAQRLAQAAENSYVALIATCALAQVQMVLGQRRLAFHTGQQALRLASERSGSALPAAAYAYVGMGQLLYEWNQLDEAAHSLREGITLSERWQTGDMLVYGATVLAQVQQAQGDTPGALELLEYAERARQRYPQQTWITAIMVAQQVRLALAQGHLEAADRWAEQAGSGYVGTFEQVTRVRIALAQGQPDQALAILKPLVPQARASGRLGNLIELQMLEALAYQQQENLPRALHTLEEALILAEPEGYLRLFVDEGAPMARLLSTVLRQRYQPSQRHTQHASSAYLKRLLAAFAPPPAPALDGTRAATLAQSLVEPLSARELEMVRLLAAGQSNAEIACELVLEVSTVKWHLKHLYSKLNVSSRTQAVAQARMLGLC